MAPPRVDPRALTGAGDPEPRRLIHPEVEDAAEGVVRLEQGQADHAERLIDIRKQVDAQNARITDHKRANVETAERIEAYIRGERRDLLEAKQGLEASVTELLHLDSPLPPPSERQIGDD